jgi:EmrB/QacA subfamily drug resistance transporter
MSLVDSTAIPVALPAVQEALGATAVDAQWVVAAYTLFLASLVLLGGSLGDHLGRRHIFSIGVVLYALASVWCGFSPNPEQLLAARALQGVAAALLVPNSLAIIGASFEEERRGRAIGTWTSLTSVTLVLGPILGGYLAENISWRGLFFIKVPLAVVVLVITHSRVPESRDPEARRLDLTGATLAAVGFGGVVYGLLESSRVGLLGAPWVVGALAVGVVALGAFLVVEGHLREPMMPLSLFRLRNFTVANASTLLLYFALYGTLFFLPFNLIWVQGYSATLAGVAIMPTFVLMSLLSRYTGGLTDRYGPRLPLVVGPAIAAVGFALFAVPGIGGSYWTTFFPATVALGIGLSILVPAVTTTALNAVDVRYEGLASAINNAFSQTAGLLAVAVLGVLMFVSFGSSLDDRLATLNLPPEATQQLQEDKVKLGAAQAPEGLNAAQSTQVERTLDEAFVSGYRVVMLVATAMALVSAISAALLLQVKKPKGHAEEA